MVCTEVAADVSRRCSWQGKNAPTDVGGYTLVARRIIAGLGATVRALFHRKAKVVLLLKVWPGRRIVEGKPG